MAGTVKYKAELAYKQEITSKKLKVTIVHGLDINSYYVTRTIGGDYGNSKLMLNGAHVDGALPFYIVRSVEDNDVYNDVYVDSSIGTDEFSIQIEALPTVTTSECFKNAITDTLMELGVL